jgi:histidinol-phosphate aminotransferase
MTTSSSLFPLAVAGVQQLVPYLPGKPIDELQRELGLDRVIKLASNENPLGPGKKALAAMQKAMPELALYPDGSGFHLKNALAKKFRVEPAQITLGNGSNDILELIARAFLAPGLNAVFSQHAFALYPIVTQAVGAASIVAPAVHYSHDLAAMHERIDAQTRVVFIANPNNPTGTLLAHSPLEDFIKSLPSSCICVLDEAYYEFVYRQNGQDTIGWLGHCPNLVIVRTFSKAYGLAGLRVGYAISSPEMADILNRVRQPFNNNSLALAAAEAALDDSEHLQNTIKNNALGMKQLTEGFRNLGLNWIPSSGNFVAVDLSEPAYPVYEALLRKGVIVRPVANYEMPNHLRISIGTPEENNLFLQALTECLNDV